MKRRLVHRLPASFWLSSCFLVLFCLPGAGSASSVPTDSVHFCGVVDHEAWLRDHSSPADKRASNLDAAEPRTVRMFYFLPNDRPFRQEMVDSMKATMRRLQRFFGEQMAAHGYGPMTFRYEADCDGAPVVHRVDGDHGDAHYLVVTDGRVRREIGRVFSRMNVVHLIFVDNSSGLIHTYWGRGVAGLGGGDKRSGHAIVGRFTFVLAAHELAHAFGMGWHDFRDDAYILSYSDNPPYRLSACAAGYLSVHPYFNPEVPLEPSGRPDVAFLGPRARYPAGAERVALRVRVTDPDGVYQVSLFSWETDGGSVVPRMKTCRALAVETAAVVTFDYDGVVPGSAGTSLSHPPSRRMRVAATDTKGETGSVRMFGIAQASPYLLTSVGRQTETESVTSAAFSPDGGTLGYVIASGRGAGAVVLWDVMREREITRLTGRGDEPSALAFSPGGGILAVGGVGGTVTLWDVLREREIAVLRGHEDFVVSVAFSPGGGLLASASYDGTVRLWDVAERAETAVLKGHPGRQEESPAFSPDGRFLAFGRTDTVILWDVASRKAVSAFEEERWVYAVAFSPDGGLLASGMSDGTVTLRDAATGEKIATLAGHLSTVYALAFSPGGGILASGSSDRTVRLWDVVREDVVQTFWHTKTARSISYSADGRKLAAAAIDVVEVWDTSEWVVPRASQLLSLSGDGQQGAPGSALPRPFVVEVRDQQGEPYAGAAVTFTVTKGGGRLGGTFDTQRTQSDTLGRASVVLTLGPVPGAHVVEVTLGGRTLTTFHAEGVGTRVVPAEGDFQQWQLPVGAVMRLGMGYISEGDRAVDVSPDGRYVGVATAIGAWVYDVQAARFVRLFPSGGAYSVSFSPNGATVAMADRGRIGLWDLDTGTQRGALKKHGAYYNVAAFSPGGSTLASGQTDGTVGLWDVAARREVAVLEGHTRRVNSLSFSPDGTMLASASRDSTVRLWDLDAEDEIAVLRGHGGRVMSVAFSPDGGTVASGSWDRTVRLWDVAARAEREALTIHSHGVTAVAFSPGGGILASGTWVGALKLWDVATRQEREALSVRGAVRSLAFSPDGTTLVSGGNEGVEMRHVATGSTSRLPGFGNFGSMAISPVGSILAVSSGGEIMLWDLSSRSGVIPLEGLAGGSGALAFSVDGTTLASVQHDRITRITLWDVARRKQVAALDGYSGRVVALALSPDVSTLVSAEDNATVRVWDFGQRHVVATMTTGQERVQSAAFTPGGGILASGSRDGTIVLWDVPVRTGTAVFQGHIGGVDALAFSSDASLLASSGGDRRIRLWDVAARSEVATLARPRIHTSSLAFSPGGAALTSGDWSGAIRLWDVSARKEVAALRGHTGGVRALAFSPDGTMLVSGSWDGTMLVWDMQRVVPRPHTLKEAAGLEQTGLAGTALAMPFVVAVQDQNGQPYAGVTVTFVVTAGGGTLSVTTDTTDAQGRAATTLTLGTLPGTNTVVAAVADVEPVAFTALGQANPDVGDFPWTGTTRVYRSTTWVRPTLTSTATARSALTISCNSRRSSD